MYTARDDIILIQNLSIQASIGLLPEEKMHDQTLILSLAIHYPAAAAPHHQRINYFTLTNFVCQCSTGKHFLFLETYADIICQSLLATFLPIRRIELTVWKPEALEQARPGLSIERVRY